MSPHRVSSAVLRGQRVESQRKSRAPKIKPSTAPRGAKENPMVKKNTAVETEVVETPATESTTTTTACEKASALADSVVEAITSPTGKKVAIGVLVGGFIAYRVYKFFKKPEVPAVDPAYKA